MASLAVGRTAPPVQRRINSPQSLLILDWDGTVAATDTLSLIAPSAEALKPYTEAYIKDMKTLSDTLGERSSIQQMFNYLDRMEDVEQKSITRVEAGGLFRGMPRNDLLARASDLSLLDLQPGVVSLLREFKGQWGIVSVGWSGDFIRKALQVRDVDLTSNKIKIFANEVEWDKGGLGTGGLNKNADGGIRTARDKKREMKRMVDEWRSSESGPVVYVGDSETDLMCLLEADLGIIMNSPKMVEKCKKLGLVVRQGLDDLDLKNDGNVSSQAKQLRFVSDFKDFLDA